MVSTIRVDQIRTVDRRRLVRRLGKIDPAALHQVDDAIRISLGLIAL
jgi:mRNA-degrading endonuclease toxin of MazEF toxin-antitoxin module